MTPYNTQIVLDSIDPDGEHRVTTFRTTIPYIALPDLTRHRVLSYSVGSTRAKPTRLFIQEVIHQPFVPLEWGANRAGMQAKGSISGWRAWVCLRVWLLARWPAILAAIVFTKCGLHKQWAALVLTPWLFIDVVMTGSQFDNFFALRCHSAARPELRKVAVRMARLSRDSKPTVLHWGQWHLPFVSLDEREFSSTQDQLIMSAARCARTSVYGFDGEPKTLEDDRKTYHKLMKGTPKHASPVEHQCYFSHLSRMGGNLGDGIVQHRKTIEGECVRHFDFATLDEFPND